MASHHGVACTAGNEITDTESGGGGGDRTRTASWRRIRQGSMRVEWVSELLWWTARTITSAQLRLRESESMVTWVRKAQVKEMLRRSGDCDGVRSHGCGVGHWAGFCLGPAAGVMAFLCGWLHGGGWCVAALQARDITKLDRLFVSFLFDARPPAFCASSTSLLREIANVAPLPLCHHEQNLNVPRSSHLSLLFPSTNKCTSSFKLYSQKSVQEFF
jgi:hypothetical protein